MTSIVKSASMCIRIPTNSIRIQPEQQKKNKQQSNNNRDRQSRFH